MQTLQRRTGTRRMTLCVFLATGFLYLFTAPLRIENIDGQMRFEVAWAFLQTGVPQPQHTDYLNLVSVRGRDGTKLSYYGPGHSLLALPFLGAAWALARDEHLPAEVAFSAVNVVVGAAAVAVFMQVLLRLGTPPRRAVAAASLLAFASCLWPAALTTMEGPQVALGMLLLVLAALWRRTNPGWGPLVLGGVTLGWLGLTRETDAAAALPLVGALVLAAGGTWRERLRALAVVVAAALPFFAVYVGYSLWRYGIPHSLVGRIRVLQEQGRPLTPQPLKALWGLTLGWTKGIVFYSPLVVAGLAAWPRLWCRDRGVAGSCLAVFVLTLLSVLPLAAWRGDWAWGPRYLYGVAPLLLIALPDALAWCRARACKVLFGALVAAALTVQLAGVSVFYFRYFLDKGLEMNYVYGQLPDHKLPVPQFAYNLDVLPRIARRTAERLSRAHLEPAVNPGMDAAAAPEGPEPLSVMGPLWARQYAAFDTVPFWWIYWDLVTGARHRAWFRGAAALLALGFAVAAASVLRELRER